MTRLRKTPLTILAVISSPFWAGAFAIFVVAALAIGLSSKEGE